MIKIEPVNFSIPKGSLEEATFKLLEESWTKVRRRSRTYSVFLDDPDIQVKMLRPQEIPTLVGDFELPLSVGIVGGVIQHHPIAKICTKILGVSTANELSCIMAAVGLAQNFAAMRALVTEGIQKGHMKLHARKEGKN